MWLWYFLFRCPFFILIVSAYNPIVFISWNINHHKPHIFIEIPNIAWDVIIKQAHIFIVLRVPYRITFPIFHCYEETYSIKLWLYFTTYSNRCFRFFNLWIFLIHNKIILDNFTSVRIRTWIFQIILHVQNIYVKQYPNDSLVLPYPCKIKW